MLILRKNKQKNKNSLSYNTNKNLILLFEHSDLAPQNAKKLQRTTPKICLTEFPKWLEEIIITAK